MEYKVGKSLDSSKIERLYTDAGWYAYTKNVPLLMEAIENSLYVLTAWDEDELVGLVRVVGDGLTIIYIQDILVLKAYQNKGIATELIQQVERTFETIRQKVLLTEEAPDVRNLYEKNGFQSCDKGTLVAFAKLT